MEKDMTHQFVTKTGMEIFVRPLRPEDAPYLVDLFENMSAESRYNRFLQTTENVDIDRVWLEAENIASQTNSASVGMVAFSNLPDRANAPVGAARYVKITGQQAEIAISVRDDMQHVGIGTQLLRLLVDQAADEGIDQLVGTVQNSNVPMWAMLKKLGHRLERHPEGSYSLIILHVHETDSRVEDWMDAAADYSPEPQIVW